MSVCIYSRLRGNQRYSIWRESSNRYTLWNNGNYLGDADNDTALINVINDCINLIDKANELAINRVLTK